MPLASLQNIHLSFGHGPLLEDASLQIEQGERVCLLGRNGTGKSSLMRLLSGESRPDSGEVVLQTGVRITALPQEVPGYLEGSVYDVVAGGASGAPGHEVDAIITRLNLEPDAPFAQLSGGLKRRAWLGRALAGEPDVLLLDEPTNHLDIDSIAWLEDFLLRSGKTLLFVSHDRAFLRRLATRIVEIDRGKLQSWDCDYDAYLVRKTAALEAEEKQRALFDKRLAQEEAWIRRGVEARRTKSQSRISALMQMRQERSERRERLGTAKLQLQDVRRSGRLVIETENASFSYEGKPIVQNLSTMIMRGDKIGIIGPNGSGKTTLLRLLLGQLEPQQGTVRQGTRLDVAYLDQLRDQIDEDLTVQQNVAADNATVTINGEKRNILSYLQDFLFSPERARSSASVLSGGERNRLLLAKLFTQPANLLVLDEPTNDLDVETLDLLENLIVEFSGTVLLVSHDRDFLNNVATSTLVFEREDENADSYTLRDYAGGYDDWLWQRPKKEEVAAPAKPVVKAAPAKTRARRLSFNEERDLKALPERIEQLESKHQELVEKMADPALYQDSGEKAAAVKKDLTDLEAELAAAFKRWEELLELEESIRAASV